jgi:hypothetical protein
MCCEPKPHQPAPTFGQASHSWPGSPNQPSSHSRCSTAVDVLFWSFNVTVTGYAPTRMRGALHSRWLELTTTGSVQRSVPGPGAAAAATAVALGGSQKARMVWRKSPQAVYARRHGGAHAHKALQHPPTNTAGSGPVRVPLDPRFTPTICEDRHTRRRRRQPHSAESPERRHTSPSPSGGTTRDA